jgi:hypothetical protein
MYYYALEHCDCEINDDQVTFTGVCTVTGTLCTVTVPLSGVVAWERGAKIQDAFPGTCASDREFLKSGISATGWERMFVNGDID